MADSLWNERTFQLLNIVDDFNREVLHIEADTSQPTARLIRCLEMLKLTKGLPKMKRVDNCPELISATPNTSCRENNITPTFYPTGKAYANSLCRILQRQYQTRTVKHVPVPNARRSTSTGRDLETGLQREQAS
jgi:putative transposase